MKARLPIEYRYKDAKRLIEEQRAEKRAQEIFKEYESYSVDITAMTFLLSIIRRRKWGTGKRATKIPTLIQDVQETLDYYLERYDPDCAYTAIKRDLAEYGVVWERGNDDKQ